MLQLCVELNLVLHRWLSARNAAGPWKPSAPAWTAPISML